MESDGRAAKEFEISLRLNPNEADAWDALSDLRVMEGRGEEAVACSVKALRLSPHPTSTYLWGLRQAQYAAGQYQAAVKTLRNEATYKVLPRRWVVERTFAWFTRWRRLVRDYEQRLDVSEAMIHVAMSSLLLRRISH